MRAGAGNSSRRQNEGFVQGLCTLVCVCVCVSAETCKHVAVMRKSFTGTSVTHKDNSRKERMPALHTLAGLWKSGHLSFPSSPERQHAGNIHCLTVLIAISLKYKFPLVSLETT